MRTRGPLGAILGALAMTEEQMLTMVFPIKAPKGYRLPHPVCLVKPETEEESAEILAVAQAAGLAVIVTEAGLVFHLPQSLHAPLYYRVTDTTESPKGGGRPMPRQAERGRRRRRRRCACGCGEMCTRPGSKFKPGHVHRLPERRAKARARAKAETHARLMIESIDRGKGGST